MKITVFTIPDCQFSKQEKDYLTANKLTFEEKNLEANREFLTEMMTLSNNFAGTPVTKVEKDDGQIAVLKGFTKEEFDKTFGLTPAEPAMAEMNAQVNAPSPTPVPQPPEPPKAPEPLPSDSSSVVPTKEEAPAKEEPTPEPAPQPPVQPTEPPKTDDQLKSVLADLEQKSSEPAAPQSPPPPTSSSNLPNIPDFK